MFSWLESRAVAEIHSVYELHDVSETYVAHEFGTPWSRSNSHAVQGLGCSALPHVTNRQDPLLPELSIMLLPQNYVITMSDLRSRLPAAKLIITAELSFVALQQTTAMSLKMDSAQEDSPRVLPPKVPCALPSLFRQAEGSL